MGTGAGPHAGDTEAPRNGLDPAVVSQAHAISVYLLVVLTITLLVVAVRSGHRWLALVTSLVLVGLPVLLVALHMLGASLLAAGLARILLAVRPHLGERRPSSVDQPDPSDQLNSGSSATATKSNDR